MGSRCNSNSKCRCNRCRCSRECQGSRALLEPPHNPDFAKRRLISAFCSPSGRVSCTPPSLSLSRLAPLPCAFFFLLCLCVMCICVCLSAWFERFFFFLCSVLSINPLSVKKKKRKKKK